MKKQLLLIIGALWLSWFALSACNSQNSTVSPVEREQIKNVVKDYVVRDTSIPNYEVTIEATAENWARVSLVPAQVANESRKSTVYLQKQVEGDGAPTAVIAEQTGHEARASTTTGWAIILGPQADFNKAELDQVGVPSEVRP